MTEFSQIFDSFADSLKSVLPTSPFQPYIQQFRNLPYMGWLNWFIPVRACLQIAGAWLAAIALFYIYIIVLRWIKAIGS